MDYNAILSASVYMYKERNFTSTFFSNDVTRRSPDTRLKDRAFAKLRFVAFVDENR